MKERLKQPFNGEMKAVSTPDQRVCVYCRQKINEGCFACRSEGLYRHFEPQILTFRKPPQLPAFKELLEMPAATRLAFVYLGLYYYLHEGKEEELR